MTKITTALTLALISQLYGCETYYQAPEPSIAAKVRFVNPDADQKILVTVYDGPGCQIGPKGGIMGAVGGINKDPLGNVPPLIRSSGNSLGMIGYNEGSVRPIERLVPVRNNLTFSTFRLVGANSSFVTTCTTTFQFNPVVGGEYEIKYIERQGYCGVEAFRLSSATDGTPVREAEPSLRPGIEKCTGREAVK